MTVSATKAIVLADEADFVLGSLQIRPSSREVRSESLSESLEPRVMQVLVALFHNREEVVSRDSLVTSCWSGRSVSEDAIQRCIAKLRKLSEVSKGFHIDTIARVGYRMRCDAPPATLPSEPVLAVLPFDNLSHDHEMQFFSDGLTEEILHAVSRVPGIKLIGRSSSFRFRGEHKGTREIAAALNATHLLDGSVRYADNRVRVAIHLVETTGHTTVLTERFERDLSDVLAIQDEIAAVVGEALRRSFTPSVAPDAVDRVGYEFYLRGRELLRRGNTTDMAQALGLFEVASTRAPGFSKIWSALANARLSLLTVATQSEATPLIAAARDAAERALTISPESSEALAVLAMCLPTNQWAAKETLHLRSLSAQNDPFAQMVYSIFLAGVGRLSEFAALLSKAHVLDPLNANVASGWAVYLAQSGHTERAREVFAELRRRSLGNATAWYSEMLCEGFWGDSQRALHLLTPEGGLPLEVDDSLRAAYQLHIQLLRNPTGEELSRAARIYSNRAKRDPSAALDQAVGMASIGLLDAAYELLDSTRLSTRPIIAGFGSDFRTYYGIGNLNSLFVNAAPAMRRDKRFVPLCARLGLVDYWLASGKWPDCADEVAPFYDFKAACRDSLSTASTT